MQCREAVGETRPVGQGQLRIQLEQRGEDEAAVVDLRVGQRQPLGGELDLAEQQQVDVERARAVTRAQRPAALDLDRLADVEQRLRLEIGADPDAGVEKVGLLGDLPDRLRLVRRRDRLDGDRMVGQLLDRGAQMPGTVTDVRAETEIPGELRRARLRPPRRRRAGFRG